MRKDEEVVFDLKYLYKQKFNGEKDRKFVISKEQLRRLYNEVDKSTAIEPPRWDSLVACGYKEGLHIFDIRNGEVAVIKTATADVWRRVPERLIDGLRPDDV